LVAPITCRAAATASGPSITIATSGPWVMNSTSVAEEWLLSVLLVVNAGELLVDLHLLQRHQPQALALEAGRSPRP